MDRESNIGEYGVESIRVDGMRIERLPLGRGEIAKGQIPLALDVERQNEIEGILARYPKHDIDYLEGRIREAKTVRARFQEEIDGLKKKIGEYRVHLKQCEGKRRPSEVEEGIKQIVALDLPHDEKVQRIKEAKQDMAPWDVDGLENQIGLFEDSINRYLDGVIDESNVIAMLSELVGLVKMRDMELANKGYKVA